MNIVMSKLAGVVKLTDEAKKWNPSNALRLSIKISPKDLRGMVDDLNFVIKHSPDALNFIEVDLIKYQRNEMTRQEWWDTIDDAIAAEPSLVRFKTMLQEGTLEPSIFTEIPTEHMETAPFRLRVNGYALQATSHIATRITGV